MNEANVPLYQINPPQCPVELVLAPPFTHKSPSASRWPVRCKACSRSNGHSLARERNADRWPVNGSPAGNPSRRPYLRCGTCQWNNHYLRTAPWPDPSGRLLKRDLCVKGGANTVKWKISCTGSRPAVPYPASSAPVAFPAPREICPDPADPLPPATNKICNLLSCSGPRIKPVLYSHNRLIIQGGRIGHACLSAG